MRQIRPDGNERIFSLTLNNFACYYKKVLKPRVALKYLNMALKLEKVSGVSGPELSATYLNLCAIYSELRLYGEAINKAIKSVVVLKSYLKHLNSPDEPVKNNDLSQVINANKSALKQSFNNTEAKHDALRSGATSGLLSAADPMSRGATSPPVLPQTLTQEDKLTIMGTYTAAYFNLGVSFEHLKQYKLAQQAYERGMLICAEHMPKNKQLIHSFQEAIHIAN